ncbi:MAG: ATP-grasp domain-containing protein [Clostridiales bacterium]|nr:ATP-grasp domain-containing protein [Clostridiales bacterium]
MKKIAIIGASYLQLPLINKAKDMNLETHVFAWAANDVGETAADHFYPISIIEKDLILEKCREIKIDGICSIASDLAMTTVNYVAEKMGLPGNSIEATLVSTNKHLMRKRFADNGDPSVKSIQIIDLKDVNPDDFSYPVIVKPEDRSGSRGISKITDKTELKDAVKLAQEASFNGHALIEEFAEGEEFSAETISFNGKHKLLAITKKYTTGAPHFIETGHMEPAFPRDSKMFSRIEEMVYHALDGLGLQNGASHTEYKIDSKGQIRLIEIGGRMGGDCIGSSLVHLSTGVDFVKAIIEVALGNEPDSQIKKDICAAIRYVFAPEDIKILEQMKNDPAITIEEENNVTIPDHTVTDSSARSGYYIFTAEKIDDLRKYLD